MLDYNQSLKVCTICALNGRDVVDVSYERDKEMCDRFEFLLQIKFDWDDGSISKKFCTVCIQLLRSFSVYFNWCHRVQKTFIRRVDEVSRFSTCEQFHSAENFKQELLNDSHCAPNEDGKPKIVDLVTTSNVNTKWEVVKEENEEWKPKIDVLVSTLPVSIKEEIIKVGNEEGKPIIDVLVSTLPVSIKGEIIKVENEEGKPIIDVLVSTWKVNTEQEMVKVENEAGKPIIDILVSTLPVSIKEEIIKVGNEEGKPKTDVLVSTLPVSIKREIINEKIINSQITENLTESSNSEFIFKATKTLPCETVTYKLPNPDWEYGPQSECEPKVNKVNSWNNNRIADKVHSGDTVSRVSDSLINNDKDQNVPVKSERSYQENKTKRKRKPVKVPTVENYSRSRNQILEEIRWRSRKAPRLVLPKSVPESDSVSTSHTAVGGNALQIILTSPSPDDPVFPVPLGGTSPQTAEAEFAAKLTCKRERELTEPVSENRKSTRNSKDFSVRRLDLKSVQKLSGEIVTSIGSKTEICEEIYADNLKPYRKPFELVVRKELKHLLEADYKNLEMRSDGSRCVKVYKCVSSND